MATSCIFLIVFAHFPWNMYSASVRHLESGMKTLYQKKVWLLAAGECASNCYVGTTGYFLQPHTSE